MSTYSLIDSDNNVLRTEQNIDPNVPTKEGYKWVEVVAPVEQKITETQDIVLKADVVDKKLIQYWEVKELSIKELESKKKDELSSVPPIILKALLKLENTLNKTELTLEQYIEELLKL